MTDDIRSRPVVGTRGGCGEGRGPCACPRGHGMHHGYAFGRHIVEQRGLVLALLATGCIWVWPIAWITLHPGQALGPCIHSIPCPSRTRPQLLPDFGCQHSSLRPPPMLHISWHL